MEFVRFILVEKRRMAGISSRSVPKPIEVDYKMVKGINFKL